jgi:hypothetical protein
MSLKNQVNSISNNSWLQQKDGTWKSEGEFFSKCEYDRFDSPSFHLECIGNDYSVEVSINLYRVIRELYTKGLLSFLESKVALLIKDFNIKRSAKSIALELYEYATRNNEYTMIKGIR